MNSSLIDELSEVRGIESTYIDAWGKPVDIAEVTKVSLLSAMGYDVKDESKLIDQVNQQVQRDWLRPLNPVQVVKESDAISIAVRLPIELATEDFTFAIVGENEKLKEHPFSAIDGELVNVMHFNDGDEFQEYLVELPMTLSAGYYECRLQDVDENNISSMRLIIAPKQCYRHTTAQQNNKIWGVTAQLYCLRSDDNWGIGDFGDLKRLATGLANKGANFIGLNPMHALYLNHPKTCSPYGPSSRKWLNTLYLNVPALEGFEQPEVQSEFYSLAFQSKLNQVRQSKYVDYTGVTELKLNILERIFAWYNTTYLSKPCLKQEAFNAFVKAGGGTLDNLATFEAIQAYLIERELPNWGWPVFPEELNQSDKPAVKVFKKEHAYRIKFYLYLQWQASLQLEEAHQQALASGMTVGLYRDLAVGDSEGSSEIWSNQDLYALKASIGAPPDVMGPLGQKWGLPPMNPDTLYQQQYQPIIDLFSANMSSCGALRLDHVMALLRLWWVGADDEAKQGGYVYYPMDDLLGILALESQRNQTTIVGEDLGTVPPEIKAKLAEQGILSYRVFLFEQAHDGGFFSPEHYPEQSLAALTTHDIPTLRGYWHCNDLALAKELKLYDEEVLPHLYDKRLTDKQSILDSLHGHGALPAGHSKDASQTGMHQALNHALQNHMAKGNSTMLSLQLEDWLDMDEPVNVPGTSNEYPNWQRKLNRTLEEILADPDLSQLCEDLTGSRQSTYTMTS
jgi:4-alpha-glucanotransferase